MAMLKQNSAATNTAAANTDSKFEDPDLEQFEGEGSNEGAGTAPDVTQAISEEMRARIAASQANQAERLAAAEAEAAKTGEVVAANQPATTTAVAVAKTSAMAVARPVALSDPLAPLKDACPVTFNMFESLMANAGNLIVKSTNAVVGQTMDMELISFQYQWVIGTGTEDEEDKEHVRYSDDGIDIQSTGESCKEYLAQIKANGFPDAKMDKRVILVGEALTAGKVPQLVGDIIQVSLAPTSLTQFERHKMLTAYNISKGRQSPEGATRVRLTCEPATSTKGNKQYTLVKFSAVPAA